MHSQMSDQSVILTVGLFTGSLIQSLIINNEDYVVSVCVGCTGSMLHVWTSPAAITSQTRCIENDIHRIKVPF